MDDKQIINLFFQRDEDAINAVDEKYGSKLNALAANILQSREDGLECVNDTYMKAWNSIPPAKTRVFIRISGGICKKYCD